MLFFIPLSIILQVSVKNHIITPFRNNVDSIDAYKNPLESRAGCCSQHVRRDLRGLKDLVNSAESKPATPVHEGVSDMVTTLHARLRESVGCAISDSAKAESK